MSNSPTDREPALNVPDIRVPVFADDGRRLTDYPELQDIFDRLAAEVDAEPPWTGDLDELLGR